MKKIILLILIIYNYSMPQNFSTKEINIIEYYPILLKSFNFEEQKVIYLANKNIYNIKNLNIQKFKIVLNNFYLQSNLLNYKIYSEIFTNILYNISINKKITITPILHEYLQKFSGYYTSHTFLPTVNINYHYKNIYLNYYINKINFNTGILFFNKYFTNAISFKQNLDATEKEFFYFSLIQLNNNLKLSITYFINQKSIKIKWYIKIKKYFINLQIKYHPYLPQNKLIEIGRAL